MGGLEYHPRGFAAERWRKPPNLLTYLMQRRADGGGRGVRPGQEDVVDVAEDRRIVQERGGAFLLHCFEVHVQQVTGWWQGEAAGAGNGWWCWCFGKGRNELTGGKGVCAADRQETDEQTETRAHMHVLLLLSIHPSTTRTHMHTYIHIDTKALTTHRKSARSWRRVSRIEDSMASNSLCTRASRLCVCVCMHACMRVSILMNG